MTREQRAALERVMTDLRTKVPADRTTLRLDFIGHRFPVVAESLGGTLHSIRDDETFDLRSAPSSRAVLETRRMLVQEDCLAHEHAPPAEFVSRYGVRAQILCPLVVDDRVIGIVSVHSRHAPQRWSPSTLTAVREAADEVRGVLGIPEPPNEL